MCTLFTCMQAQVCRFNKYNIVHAPHTGYVTCVASFKVDLQDASSWTIASANQGAAGALGAVAGVGAQSGDGRAVGNSGKEGKHERHDWGHDMDGAERAHGKFMNRHEKGARVTMP